MVKRKFRKNKNPMNAKPKKRKSMALFWLLAFLFMLAGIVIAVGVGSSWFKNWKVATWFNSWGEGTKIEQPSDENGEETPEGAEPEFEFEVEESEK